LKKIAIILGSALGVLLLFSVISYANSLIQAQNPKPASQEKVLEVAGQVPETAPEPVPAKTPEATPAFVFSPRPMPRPGIFETLELRPAARCPVSAADLNC